MEKFIVRTIDENFWIISCYHSWLLLLTYSLISFIEETNIEYNDCMPWSFSEDTTDEAQRVFAMTVQRRYSQWSKESVCHDRSIKIQPMKHNEVCHDRSTEIQSVKHNKLCHDRSVEIQSMKHIDGFISQWISHSEWRATHH